MKKGNRLRTLKPSQRPDPSVSVLYLRLTTAALFLIWGQLLSAQVLTVNTVTRPPFSMVEEGRDTGFSLELLKILAGRLDWEYRVNRTNSFADMLDGVRKYLDHRLARSGDGLQPADLRKRPADHGARR